MLYMRPGRLLMYFGIITVFIVYVLHDAQGYRLKKTYKHKTSHGQFMGNLYGKHNRDTLQSKTDKHKSKRIKTKPTIVDTKPVQMKAITGSTGRKPVVMEPKSNKAVPLKPVAPKRKKITEKPKSDPDPGVKVYNCPNEAVQMNCLSCKTKVYRKCPVVGASLVTAVHIVDQYTSSLGRCYVNRRQNFGIVDQTSVWVDKGCRAKFLVCYNREINEPKKINCACDLGSPRRVCPIGLRGADIVKKVAILWNYGKGRCKEEKTWGFDDRRIWVENGCSATFVVTWQ